MDTIDLSGQVAVVTGAGRGLGKEYAKVLATYGALLIINDNAYNEDGTSLASETAREIEDMGGCAIVNTDDISTRDGCRNLIETVENNFGFVDIFIHNAGFILEKDFLEHDDFDWNKMLDIHLNASYYLLKGIIPLMMKKKYGRIVMVTSTDGMFGLEKQAGYAAAKMGVFGLVQVIKQEFQDMDIKCNLISPLAATQQTKNALQGILVEKLSPEKAAPIIGYLCSPQCRHNGKVFIAAGGYFSCIGFCQGEGVFIPKEQLTAQSVYNKIDRITDFTYASPISSSRQTAKKIFKKIFI